MNEAGQLSRQKAVPLTHRGAQDDRRDFADRQAVDAGTYLRRKRCRLHDRGEVTIIAVVTSITGDSAPPGSDPQELPFTVNQDR
jgi:hypothetical protein